MKARNRSGLSWRGVTAQLFVLVILPLSVLTIGIAFGGLALHRNAMRAMVGDRDERSARAAAGAIAEQLNHRLKAIQGLALLAVEATTPEPAAGVLSASDYLLEDFDLGLAIFTRGGVLQAAVGSTEFWQNLTTTMPALAQALERDAPPPLLELPHPLTGEPVILVLAVKQKGGPVAAGAFDPAILARKALPDIFLSGANYGAYLMDAGGNLLFQGGALPLENVQEHPGFQEALAGDSGTLYVPAPDGEHVVSYSPIDPPGWALVIEEPWEDVTSPLLRLTEYAPFVLIPALLLALLALWFVARQIVMPLQALEGRAAELGRGHYEAIEAPVGGIAEIQNLQDELIRLGRKVNAAQASLRGYIGVITTGQEEERRRLARELHDDTLQSLIALNQRIQLARLDVADNARPAESLEEVQQLTAQTITDLRRISRALRPIYLEDLGLVAALEMLAKEITQLGDLAVDFHQAGEIRRLDEHIELALFRITQEALNNSARHAQAGHAYLHIEFSQDTVILHLKDDGQGFNPPETPTELAPLGHFGLLGMHERAELIGAELKIQSRVGAGTHIQITCPHPW
jgi:signal transduction histidine kinase